MKTDTTMEAIVSHELFGVLAIADERRRQIEVEGWSAGHDDKEHREGDLVDAAMCYAAVASAQSRGSTAEEWPVGMFDGFCDSILQWPWEEEWYKPKDDPIANLVRAGALIAAEIDRLNRAQQTAEPNRDVDP